jgi:hypothetical protein
MAKVGKDGWVFKGSTWNEEDFRQLKMNKESEKMHVKTVMVYWMDQTKMTKEPIGILTERRKSERDDNNAIGMLRLARKVFAQTEEQAKRITIGDYV